MRIVGVVGVGGVVKVDVLCVLKDCRFWGGFLKDVLFFDRLSMFFEVFLWKDVLCF